MRQAHPIERQVGMAYYVSDADGVGGRLRVDPEDFRVRELERVDPQPADADTGDYPYLLLRATLRERGLAVTDDPDAATVVLGSFDREFHYDRLAESLWALEDADAFFGTDPDRTVPTDDRPIPGSGAIVAAMAGVAEREPDAMLGKPSHFARRTALERLGTDPTRTLVVGDRLDTDVALAGDDMASALVLTGVDGRDDVADTGPRPTHVLESLADVGDALDDATS